MSDPTPAAANIPPADEMAQLRDTIAELRRREAELRMLMLTDPTARTGNHFAAEIVTVTQERTDIKELRKMYPDQVAEHTFKHQIEQVQLREITADGVIVATRTKKKIAS